MITIKVQRAQFSAKERHNIMKKTDCKCGKCGRLLDDGTMTVDHILPIHKGGLNDEYNLIALCQDCNNAKSNFIYPISYYRHILPEYVEPYMEYHNYAMEITPRKRIMTHDIKEYRTLTDSQMDLYLRLTKKRTKNSTKALEMLGVTLKLTQAFPGDAERIYEFAKKNDENSMYIHTPHYYTNSYAVLDDIENGEVYILESASEICGVFSFHYVTEREVFIPQAKRIMDTFNYSIHAVMTYAAANKLGSRVYGAVLDNFFVWQTEKGYMPLYFNILKYVYRHKDRIISCPWSYLQNTGEIEFHDISHYKDVYQNAARSILEDLVSDKVKDSDVEYLAYMFLDRKKMADMNEVDKDFLNKFDGLAGYFMPETYDRYNERNEIKQKPVSAKTW